MGRIRKSDSRATNHDISLWTQGWIPIRPKVGYGRKSQRTLDRRKMRSEEKEQWEKGLVCVCRSGLPVLQRFTVGGEWTGHCRRCKT